MSKRRNLSDDSSLTLGESDVKLLQLAGILPKDIVSVHALRLALERSKATHVGVHVLDTGGNMVFQTEFNNPGGKPPTVKDLRDQLAQHFKTTAEEYEDDVCRVGNGLIRIDLRLPTPDYFPTKCSGAHDPTSSGVVPR